MRRFSLFAVAVSLVLSIAACGDDDGGTPDALVLPDANRVDARLPPDARQAPDAYIPPSASVLGQPCTEDTLCPDGYICLLTNDTVTPNAGFCSLYCTGENDTFSCSAANGFTGTGVVPGCFLQLQGGDFVCGIACGTSYDPPLPETCPTGLTCIDLFTAEGTIGQDGETDICGQ